MSYEITSNTRRQLPRVASNRSWNFIKRCFKDFPPQAESRRRKTTAAERSVKPSPEFHKNIDLTISRRRRRYSFLRYLGAMGAVLVFARPPSSFADGSRRFAPVFVFALSRSYRDGFCLYADISAFARLFQFAYNDRIYFAKSTPNS